MPARANVAAREASFVCGSFVEFSLAVDDETKQITAAGFRTNGCGYLTAACDVISGWLIGRCLTELHGAEPEAIVNAIYADLGPFPPNRVHCTELAVDTLRTAFALYRKRLVREFTGESALICTCFGIAEDALERCISRNLLTRVDDVILHCKAGGGCGSCQPLIQEIIDDRIR